MKRVITELFAIWFASSLFTTVLWAQVTALINGTVRDQSVAVLPGVEISAVQTETGIIRKVVTNETEFYILSKPASRPVPVGGCATGCVF